MKNTIRPTVIGGNWKCNGMPGDCADFAAALTPTVTEGPLPEIILAVPCFLLAEAAEAFRTLPVTVAAQNVSQFPCGAYTGEISTEQLKALGVTCTIIGHSERRTLCRETDSDIAAKVTAALKSGLKVILCVGEGEDIRLENRQNEWVSAQVRSALKDFDKADTDRLIIAYEPIWAIGAGRAATPADAADMGACIRACLSDFLGSEAERIPLLYGGSVKAENTAKLLDDENVDGLLVGGASLKADSFAAIIQAACPAE